MAILHCQFSNEREMERYNDILDEFEKSATLMPRKLKPDSIKTIGLVAYGKDHNADLSIANLNLPNFTITVPLRRIMW